MLWIPPAPSPGHQHLIHVGAIGEKHIGQRASVFAFAVHVKRDFPSKDQGRRDVFGLLPEGLVLFRAVDPTEAYPFRAFVVEDFNRVAVEDTNHLAGELASQGGRGKPQGEEHSEEQEHRPVW